MKLTYEQILQAVNGTAYCEQKNGEIVFHRFTKEIEEIYRKEVPGFNEKLLASAGISLCFRTDSSRVTLRVHTEKGSSRFYFSHDVFVNGEYSDSLCNFEDKDMSGDYPKAVFPLGIYEKNFELDSGEKEIKIMFPSLAASFLISLEIDDGASFVPVNTKKKYLALGDSITQGYDCTYVHNSYTRRIAEKYNLAERNLAIGGDMFRPSVAELIREENVSFVTVAYGSNDWNGLEWSVAKENCEKYLDSLAANMPDNPVFVLSPIWRSDCERITAYGEFSKVGRLLREICGKHDNFTFIDGTDFVPHDTGFFGDGMLHPNDSGFSRYADALLSELRKYIQTVRTE